MMYAVNRKTDVMGQEILFKNSLVFVKKGLDLDGKIPSLW
jgi:hypothetical protein